MLESLFNEVAVLQPSTLLLQRRYVPVKFAKIIRTPILKKLCERLLLNIVSVSHQDIAFLIFIACIPEGNDLHLVRLYDIVKVVHFYELLMRAS